jgi:hypothetical protein
MVVKLEIRVWGFVWCSTKTYIEKFQNEIKQREGGLWVCGVSKTCGQAHP